MTGQRWQQQVFENAMVWSYNVVPSIDRHEGRIDSRHPPQTLSILGHYTDMEVLFDWLIYSMSDPKPQHCFASDSIV